jgi:NDP-sugar pyrophosphorylase family protein
VRIAAGAAIADGATVGPYAVIGSSAVVAAGATVERAVVWPDTRVRGEVRDAIVTGAAVVPVKPD